MKDTLEKTDVMAAILRKRSTIRLERMTLLPVCYGRKGFKTYTEKQVCWCVEEHIFVV